MEPSATPWRVLEDLPEPTPAASGIAPDTGMPPGGSAGRVIAVPGTSVVIALIVLVLMVGAFVMAFGSGSSGVVAVEGGASLASGSPNAGVPRASASAKVVVVEIVGAVDRPGVFRLSAGSRVGDLVAAAGGYGQRVDAARAAHDLNLAAPLKDGDQIRVPSRDDVATATVRPSGSGGGGAGGGSSTTGPVDLNRASAGELDTLPGIGPVTAAKIVASREQQPFVAVEDLRTRKLVGEKTFAQLKDLVTVS